MTDAVHGYSYGPGMRTPSALVAVLLLATPAAAAAADGGGASLLVVSRTALPAEPTTCAVGSPFVRGSEGSPAAVAVGRRVTALWQQDVTHGGDAEIGTGSASLSNRLGGPCGAPSGGDATLMPAVAKGPDNRIWTATAVNGAQVSRVLISDGRHAPLVVDERQGTTGAGTGFLPPGLAVDGTTVHVTYVANTAPLLVRGLHRSYDTATRQWSPVHPLTIGATPAMYDFREQLVALGKGRLLALSTEVDQPGLATLAPSYLQQRDLTQAPVVVRARVSGDAGATWGQPRVVLTLANGSVRDPAPGSDSANALRSLVHPSVAVGPNGSVHVAAESVRPGGGTELLVRSSGDGGVTWSAARSLVRPDLALHTSVAVDARNRVALSWLDVDRTGSGLPATWRAALLGSSMPTALSKSFSLRALAPAYVGDQGAMVGLESGFGAVTVVGTGDPQDRTDVVLVRLR